MKNDSGSQLIGLHLNIWRMGIWPQWLEEHCSAAACKVFVPVFLCQASMCSDRHAEVHECGSSLCSGVAEEPHPTAHTRLRGCEGCLCSGHYSGNRMETDPFVSCADKVQRAWLKPVQIARMLLASKLQVCVSDCSVAADRQRARVRQSPHERHPSSQAKVLRHPCRVFLTPPESRAVLSPTPNC